MLTVNGAAVPSPASMRVSIFDVGASGNRNAAGGAILDRVAVKRRLELKWAKLDGDDLAALLQAVGGGFFQVGYPDPQNGGARTMECSCGERVLGVLRMADGAPVWTNVEMSWTER